VLFATTGNGDLDEAPMTLDAVQEMRCAEIADEAAPGTAQALLKHVMAAEQIFGKNFLKFYRHDSD
jgi:hypothetical protein